MRFAFPATVAIASGASTSSAIDQDVYAFKRLAVGYATMSTGAALAVQGSMDGTAYKNVNTLVPTSSAVQFQPLTIATSVSGSGYAVFTAPPFRYLRFVASDTVGNGAVISVFGADY